MIVKILISAAFLGCALSRPHATSFASVKQHYDNVHLDHAYHDKHNEHEHHYQHFAPSYASHNNDLEYNYDEHDHHPQYTFKYDVEDPRTQDIKSQEEHRNGDVVKGHYQLVQPDGRIRIVHYTADKDNGFKVDVTYSDHPNYYKYY